MSTAEMLTAASFGASKHEIRRWYETRTLAELQALSGGAHGFLISLTHPRPKTPKKNLEFKRLVEGGKS